MRPASGTVTRDRCMCCKTELCTVCVWTLVRSCWGICINYSILICILKYNKPSMSAIGLEHDAVWQQEWSRNAIIIFSQECFLNLQQHWKMKMALPSRSIHTLNSRGMCSGSRMPDGNLNMPLNKGSYWLWNTWPCFFSALFCAVQIIMCRNVHMNLHYHNISISSTLYECMQGCVCVCICVFLCAWDIVKDFPALRGCIAAMKVKSGDPLLKHAPFWPLKCSRLFPHNGSIA